MSSKRLRDLQAECTVIASEIWDMTPPNQRKESWELHLRTLIAVGQDAMLRQIYFELKAETHE